MADVEMINGVKVGFAFLRFFKSHTEIGEPVSEQEGDVNGFQWFKNAKLTWTGKKVEVYWFNDDAPKPEWMGDGTTAQFEV